MEKEEEGPEKDKAEKKEVSAPWARGPHQTKEQLHQEQQLQVSWVPWKRVPHPQNPSGSTEVSYNNSFYKQLVSNNDCNSSSRKLKWSSSTAKLVLRRQVGLRELQQQQRQYRQRQLGFQEWKLHSIQVRFLQDIHIQLLQDNHQRRRQEAPQELMVYLQHHHLRQRE